VLVGDPAPAPEAAAAIEAWLGSAGVVELPAAVEPELRYLGPEQVAATLTGAPPSPAALAWLRSRGLPVEVLARACIVPAGPPRSPDCPAIRPWWPASLRGDYQLVAPLYAPDGRARGLHARRTSPGTKGSGPPKTTSPADYSTSGLWLADRVAVAWMRGRPAPVVAIAEGLPDWLRLCSVAPPDVPVLGCLSGSPSSSGRLPWSGDVLIGTDPDPPGDAYAASIAAGIGDRARAVRCRPPEKKDIDDIVRSWPDFVALAS